MKLVRGLAEVDAKLRGGAVTIGNFDGVHRGHASIVDRLKWLAGRVGGPAIVFTFDPHPACLLRPDAVPPPLTQVDYRIELLAALGIDAVVVYPTDRGLLSLDPEAFFERIVRDALEARAMAEGPNFFFGRDRAGDVDVLSALCRGCDIELEIVPPLKVDGEYVSSSRIRGVIERGAVEEAETLLGRPYRLLGTVARGAGRGATIGFPTANLEHIETLLPGEGVYTALATFGGDRFPAAVNIGPNPTFGEQARKVEAHVIGFNGNLYDQPMELHFLARLRDIRPFASVDALREQLARDVTASTVKCNATEKGLKDETGDSSDTSDVSG